MTEFNWSNYQGHDRDWFDKTLGEIHEDTQADEGKTYQDTLQDMYGWTPGESSSGKPSSYSQSDYQSNVIARPTQALTPSAKTEQTVANQQANFQQKSVLADLLDQANIDNISKQDDVQANRDLNPTVDNLVKNNGEADENYQGSPQQLEDLEREFQEEQQQKLQRAREAAENQLFAQYAMTGANPYDDPMFQQSLDAVRNMDEVPTVQAEAERRFTDGNGNFEMNPLNWNILGFTSQNQTPTAARNLYDFHFNQEDQQAEPRERAFNFSNGVVDQNAIDDGADPASRESLFMTGEQYIKYRDEFGIPGRDVEDINPDEIYSKQDEQERFGFIPYITSEESLQKFHDDAASHAVANVFNHLANARRENTDFDVNFDGKRISGRDLIRQGNLWWQRNAGKEPEVITDSSKVTENSVPYTYVMTDTNGNQFVAKSALAASYRDEQGRPVMEFEDGERWTFDDDEDVQKSLGEKIADDGDFQHYWKNIEPLVLDDGTVLRADKAEELLSNNNYENFADYGDFNFNRPVIEDPFQDNRGNFNLNPAENSFLPWITDVALGSIPYFYKPTAAAQGIGNAAASYTGFQPGYQDYLNGTYSLLSDDPTREQQVSATLGSLVLPVTEHLWGNIGGNWVSKPLMKALKINEADIAPLARYGIGAVGEGLEEIPGNVVEQFQGGSGLSGWYADDMYRDEQGNLTTQPRYNDRGDIINRAYDSQGNVIKNTDTDFISRLRNFGADAPLSIIGGTTLGATLGAPRIRNYYNEYTPRKREREEFGNVMERPDFNPDLVVDLSEDERKYYNE